MSRIDPHMVTHEKCFIRETSVDVLFAIGSVHGAPPALAWPASGSRVGKFAPNCIRHVDPETPGFIRTVGELGLAVAASFGAFMDGPDLIVTYSVGDGEAAAGPIAWAWRAIKYLDAAESGYKHPDFTRQSTTSRSVSEPFFIWLHGQQVAFVALFWVKSMAR